MGVATKAGAWITASAVTRIECSQCGVVTVTRWPTNERETEALIVEHARTHGGIDRGYR